MLARPCPEWDVPVHSSKHCERCCDSSHLKVKDSEAQRMSVCPGWHQEQDLNTGDQISGPMFSATIVSWRWEGNR